MQCASRFLDWIPKVVQQLTGIVHPGPLGLSIGNLQQTLLIEDMTSGPVSYTPYHGAGRRTYDTWKTDLSRSSSSSESPISIDSGNSKHMDRPSSIIGDRQNEQETLVGISYSRE